MDFLNRACDVALAGLYMVNAEQGIRAIHDHAAGLCDLLPLREWAKVQPGWREVRCRWHWTLEWSWANVQVGHGSGLIRRPTALS